MTTSDSGKVPLQYQSHMMEGSFDYQQDLSSSVNVPDFDVDAAQYYSSDNLYSSIGMGTKAAAKIRRGLVSRNDLSVRQMGYFNANDCDVEV